MRKYWWIKVLIIIGILISWYFADDIHNNIGINIGNFYFLIYLFVLGLIFTDSLAWRMRDSTW